MNYEEALNYIHGTLKFGSKLGLSNITCLLELMGNPHKKLKYIHVAGTNGKGSTVAFISSILKEAGYRTGVFTSPYLQRFTERIRIGDDEIPAEALGRITEFVKSKVDIMLREGRNHPTEFEIITAIALQYYYEEQCDIVVLEVGLGGRFDSTNVIDAPEVAVIMTINYDHMSILGDTLDKIAFEKAGIIKDGCEVLLYPQEKEVEKVFSDICLERNANLNRVNFDDIRVLDYGIEGQVFNYGEYRELKISMLGDHQTGNAVMALNTALLLGRKGYNIDEASIRNGLLKAKWPGRLEVVCKEPIIIIDGAHNAEGAQALAGALKKYFPEKKKIFIFGVLKDKDYGSLVSSVAPMADRFIAVSPNSERALNVLELEAFLKNHCENVDRSDTIKGAISKAVQACPADGLICAFGSLYYIGEVREMFEK